MSAETFRGIDYTNAFTMLDEVLTPPPSSGLTTGGGTIANVRIQDVCPLDPYEHVLTGTSARRCRDPNVSLAGAPLLPREPELRCYVYASGC